MSFSRFNDEVKHIKVVEKDSWIHITEAKKFESLLVRGSAAPASLAPGLGEALAPMPPLRGGEASCTPRLGAVGAPESGLSPKSPKGPGGLTWWTVTGRAQPVLLPEPEAMAQWGLVWANLAPSCSPQHPCPAGPSPRLPTARSQPSPCSSRHSPS